MSRQDPILIVDSDPGCQEGLAFAFRGAGYSSCIAVDVKEAFDCLNKCLFCLILLDLDLPDMSGMCILPMLRRLYPDLPVLIHTSNDDIDTMVKALRLGAHGYLLKPVHPKQILYCINQILLDKDSTWWDKGLPQARRGQPKVAYSQKYRFH